jgi:hypothetical protein
MRKGLKRLLQKFIKLVISVGIVFLLSTSSAVAGTFECKTRDGVYKPVGKATIEAASNRDKSVLDKVFHVKRETGEILGGLFENEGHKINILRDTETTYEVLSTNRHSDVTFLKIDEFEKMRTFKFYHGWLGLFLVGECSLKP